jgi:hypothetical protein
MALIFFDCVRWWLGRGMFLPLLPQCRFVSYRRIMLALESLLARTEQFLIFGHRII